MTDKQKVYAILRDECVFFVSLLVTGWLLGFVVGHAYTGLVLALVVLLARYLFVNISLIFWVFMGRESSSSSNHIIYSVIDRIKAMINQQQLRKKQATGLARGFRDLLRALPDVIVLINKEYKIEWLSDRASQLLPLEKTDVGNVVTALIRTPDFVSFVQRKDYRSTPVISIETDYPRYLRVHKVAYNPKSDLLVFRDITSTYQMQQRQSSFIAHASHELNTPLTVIRGCVELAQKKLDKKQKSYTLLQKAIDETDRMARMTNGLLTLASIEQMNTDTAGSWFAPCQLIDSISQKLRLIEPYHSRNIIVDAQPNLLLRARATDILTVFTNIIENALKYSDEDVTVIWSASQDGSGLFSVLDRGEGMESNQIDKITERFYRIPRSAEQADPGGTGLGLSIVKAVLDIYQGKLQIESRLGEGSNFSCVFPEVIVQSSQ